MRVVRFLLAALLALALTASGVVPCVAGGAPDPTGHTVHSAASHHAHGSQESSHKKAERRVCDAMVQATLAAEPLLAPPAVVASPAAFAFAAAARINAAPVPRRVDRPPDKARPFSATFVRTGRLLI